MYLIKRILKRVAQDGSRYQNKVQFSLKRALVVKKVGAVPVEATKSPWVETKDPNGSNLTYYWNTETNETTPLGSTKPNHWIEVKSDEGLYWWNPETEETTALGAPRPPLFGQILQSSSNNYNQLNPPPQTLGSSMKTYFLLGIGMTAGITLVRLAIGI